ncbi:HipA N-terminal domain-containing protein [Paractinoplanes aksuensis]|uniref:HipA N-terminal domain-containing protein n=1 Tax=Paractinoplanes aksuensis TaxID=2939490 RepID=UPI0027E3032A|nr:HipA N-terminal domain-containing protein [Actinoplanes aksuensis]
MPAPTRRCRSECVNEPTSHLCGGRRTDRRRGRLTATFSYDRDYIALAGAYAIDPSLRLTTGAWPLPQGLPGAFSDAAPDRWGRNLIAERLRTEAGAEGRTASTLDDRDYLLGVSDETRQGARTPQLMPRGTTYADTVGTTTRASVA